VPPAAPAPVVVRLPLNDLGAACDRVAALLRPGGAGLVLVLERPGPVDLALLDVLARLRLAAGRSGTRLVLRAGDPGVAGELAALARLAGLDHLLPVQEVTSGRQPGRQPELDEQLGAEEVVHVAHPAP
jgi:hypothetical protein